MRKATVLIVEDEAIIAADLAGKLSRLGYVISATTGFGEDAVNHAREQRPDLVLMDIRLAGAMDGAEAAEIIRREFDLPVIFLTAHSDSATLERAKVTGPFGYILKPFEERELVTNIEMALFKHQSERKLRQAHDELESRIEDRTRELQEAEQVLRNTNETLEQRVAERTAELKSANETLRASRLAALNLMEDAVAAKKLAEEASVELRLEVAERKRAEVALQESNQRLDLLAETARQLLISDSPQELVNALCLKVMSFLDCDAFFNFIVDEKQGRLHLNAYAGIPEEESRSIEWLDYGVAVCGCAARDACRIVAEDIPATSDPRTDLVKSYGILAYACHPLIVQGRVLGTLSFGTRTRTRFTEDDLSLMKAVADQVAIAMDRKRTEEALREAKEAAEAASRAKSQFLANMSHELRTPMNGVLGMLQLALAGTLEEKQREFLEMAEHSATSLLRIINDILDISKIEAGKLSIEEKPFPLRRCVSEALEMFSFEARHKGLDCTLSIADDVPEGVMGDYVRLRQVLINLIGNAVKYTLRGQVAVLVQCSGATSDGKAEITFIIRDTGIGIPEDKKHLLFRSFSQVDDSNTRTYGGTGLGLAISRRIVEMMCGTISVESEEGKGSSFFFTVPFRPADFGAPAIAEGKVPDPAYGANDGSELKPRILAAEDDALAGEVLRNALEMYGFEMDLAPTGIDALQMWEQGEYDLIIMDVQMPRMDGLTATRLIREHERTTGGHIPILAMTAHAFREDEERCLAAGMDAYLTKPLDLNLGIDVLRELLKRKRQ